MNEFWLWFWRPIAEFLGTVALVGACILSVLIALVLYSCYIAWKQGRCSHDFHSCNAQWQAARWRCGKCGLETQSMNSPSFKEKP